MDAAKMMSSIRRLDEQRFNESALSHIHNVSHFVVTVAFLITVVCVPKYDVGTLVVLFVYPVTISVAAGIPAGLIFRRVAAVMPLPVCMGIFNPLLDKKVAMFFGMPIPAGWISFLTLMLKCALTVTSALILVCICGIGGICASLGTLRIPGAIVTQISFTYRYIHVLGEEVVRVLCAYRLRAPKKRGVSPAQFGSLCGSLFLRSLKRAGDIYDAMLCRGFRGSVPLAFSKPFSLYDALYAFIWICVFVLSGLIM